jgi:RHS repeat-associated protein
MGREVFNADGTLRWRGTLGQGDNNGEGPLAIVADLDLDGTPEVIAGNTAYRANGTLYWQNPAVGDGFTAVGNFDADPNPEIVVVQGGRMWLLEHTGAIKWGPVNVPSDGIHGNNAGAPAVADFDGDGQPEIGVAGGSRYAVFETSGTLKWSAVTQDFSSNKTGSSVFDFEGDGAAEVVYADELKLRVYRGTDGAVLWETPRPNGTTYDLPVVADVDGDGHAEILTVHGNAVNSTSWGLRVYGDPSWVSTRRIWNQHSYHITNVNDDGTIPPHETGSWTKYNSYRQNRLTTGCEFAKPDLTASYVRKTENGADIVLMARLGNGGGSSVAAGVSVSFYDRDPAAGGTLLATTATAAALAPGAFADVSVSVPATTVARPLWVVADDAGGLVGTVAESDETNNAYNSRVFLSPVPNEAPTVDAGADQRLVYPVSTAVLDGTVTDDGQPLGEVTTTWGTVSAPPGGTVTFGDAAAVDTTATFSTPGTYVLQLSASDGEAAPVTDRVTIVVEPANQPPVVDAGANQTVTKTSTALHATIADDGLPTGSVVAVQWSQDAGPAAVVFASPASVDTGVTFSQAGHYVFRLTATDSALSAFDTVEVDVTFVNLAPTANAGPDGQLTLPENTLTLTGTATDDGLPTGSALTYRWMAVDSPGVVTFGSPNALVTTATFSDPGVYTLRLIVSDGDLQGRDNVQVSVFSAPPTGPSPTVTLTAPVDGARVTTLTEVRGSAQSDTLASWKLEYRLEGDATYTRFAAGTTPVAEGSLGTFDPSLLLNGIYEVRLTATDTAGRNSRISTSVIVRDNLKVGQFTLSFVDLDVPVAGLPIQVRRTYDSRDKRRGDFGVAWRLEVSNVRLAEKGVAGLSFEGVSIPGFLPTYCVQPAQPHVVTVTLPDGTVYEFRPILSKTCQSGIPLEFATVTYQPLPGTQASLAATGDGYVFVVGSWPGPMELYDGGTFEIYDPEDYVLTLPDGTQYALNQTKGLTSVKDLNGNTLAVSPNGITHSSGRGITFARDTLGRITKVTDPDEHGTTYGYDTAGDLVSVSDPETHTTTFSYNPDQPHLLETIKDPLGKQPIRNEYYDDGRIKSHTDAFGKTITYAHDLVGRQEVITDRDGGVRVLEFDDRGNVVRETGADGKVVDRTFDERNNRTSETLPHDSGVTNAPKTTYVYDAAGDLRAVTDPENRTTEYAYNERKQLVLQKDAGGTYTLHAYDTKGNLFSTKTSTSPTGSPVLSETSSTYRADGSLETRTEVVDGVACVTRYEYDAAGYLIKETDGLGHVTSSTYDASGRRRTSTTTRTTPAGPEVLTTTFEYDGLGQLRKITDPDGTFTETGYDEVGRKKESRDKLGRVTRYDYDDMGRLVRTTYPDLTTEESTYDGEGHRLTFKDRGDRVTKYRYDAVGRPIKTIYSDETFTESVYNSAGLPKEFKDARGNTTFYGYDAAGRRTSVRVPLGGGVFAETLFTYDSNGNQKTVRDANLHTVTYEYDAHNRRTKTIFPDQTYRETTYDVLGRRRVERDQADKLTKFDYDCLGRLTSVTRRNEGLDLVTHYEYDEVGNRVLYRDANGRETRFEYDKVGRETARTLPDGKAETRTYWPTGSVKTRTDFMGRTTAYEYDENDRLKTRTYPEGTLPAVSFTYWPTGPRRTITVGAATTQYEYDLQDRLKTLSYPDGRTLEYGYDANGNRTSLKATVGGQTLTTSFTFDPANRLDLVTDPAGRSYDHGYDPAGNRTLLAHPNGAVTAYTYDDLNRLRDLATTHPATGVTVQSYGFTLGSAGNRTKVTEGDGTVREYGYDDLYRLTSEKVTIGALAQFEKAFAYDAVGNRKTQVTNGAGMAGTPQAAGSLTYRYDTRNRLEAENGTSAGDPVGIVYAYDDNGNLITKSGEATYLWDIENRLIQTEIGPSGSRTIVTYAYDADGNRLQTRITPPTGPPTVTTDLVDPSAGLSQVVAETDEGGHLKAYYVRGNDLLAVMRPLVAAPATPTDWQSRFVHADGIGSIRRLTDESGAIADGYTYTAFGELIAHTGTDPQPYAFAGEAYDPNTGFQYHRARWMDPRVGRFTALDPHPGRVEEPESLHGYLYADDDPLDRVDPSGLFASALFGLLVHIDIVAKYPHPHFTAGGRRWAIPGYFMALYPDIAAKPRRREVIEIKPASVYGVATGGVQLQMYLDALNYVGQSNPDLGTPWRAGYWSPAIRTYRIGLIDYAVLGNDDGVLYYWVPIRPIAQRVLDRIDAKVRAAAVRAQVRAGVATSAAIGQLAAGLDIEVMNAQFVLVMALVAAGVAMLTSQVLLQTQLSRRGAAP